MGVVPLLKCVFVCERETERGRIGSGVTPEERE